MASYNQRIKSRYLPERSFLYFSYPVGGSSAGNSIMTDFHFPLFENIDISENQKPNLATYDLVGRSGNLYAYLGSKSREFNLRFNITLLNVMDYMSNIGLNEIFERGVFDTVTKSEAKGLLIRLIPEDKRQNINYLKSSSIQEKNNDKFGNSFYARSKLVWDDLNKVDPNDSFAEIISKFEKLTPSFDRRRLDEGGLLDYLNVGNPGSKVRTVANAVNYTMFLINIIRTSVINRGSDSRSGPPTIYINHGTMYNNIPCICSNYSIKLSNNAGYDIVSMTPRQIEVTMTLLENRTGDFGKFEPFVPIQGENLAGWEAVLLGKGTLDPHNQIFLSPNEIAFNKKLEEDLAKGSSLI